MKTTFKFIIAAMAAVSVFSSCQKELANETVNDTTGGVRTIAVQFDNSTKASLSGVTPTFTNSDKIRVSNSEKSEECTVTVSGTSATFTTTLSGALTAIYPSAAAVFTTGNPDGPISDPYFKVPSVQTGLAKDAIIAKAEIAAESSSATFNGVTALFEITPLSIAKKITVTSLKQVASGSRTGTAADINTEDTGKTVITVGDGSTDLPDTIYVALVPGVKLTDLSFDAGETVGMKGIPTSKLGATTDATAAKEKYTIDNQNWHPYVTIGGKKWATMNVGATEDDPYGAYFTWGSVEKVYTALSGTTFTFPTANPDGSRYTGAWAAGSGFAKCNAPYYGSSAYTKYTGTSGDGKTVLELDDDAAYANWGGPWRTPTGGTEPDADFTALIQAAYPNYSSTSKQIAHTQTITTSGEPSSQGIYFYNVSGEAVGIYLVDGSLQKLFLPASGYGENKGLSSKTVRGGYMSSTLLTAQYNFHHQYDIFFDGTKTYLPNTNDRHLGLSVRPVAD